MRGITDNKTALQATLAALLVGGAGCTSSNSVVDMDAAAGADMAMVDLAGCSDGRLDGDETDVDCGGACSPCGTGQGCARTTDCQSGVCTNQKCAAPTCSDGVKNGTETDVDCGGTCHPCAAGQACVKGTDCASGTCTNQRCLPPPNCMDGKQDGDETDVDCGGSACPPCGDGKACRMRGDCASGLCLNNVCIASGGDAGAAPDLSMAAKDGDMAATSSDMATAMTCMDGKKDGQETDVDCGGPMCPKCDTGRKCVAAADCQSGRCSKVGQCGAAALGFAAPLVFQAATAAHRMRATDLNADGKPDLALALYGDTGVQVLLGTGGGNFSVQQPIGNLRFPQDVEAGDFNGDGKLDLTAVGFDIRVLLGRGDGSFDPPIVTAYGGGGSTYALRAADFDGDGKLDLVLPGPQGPVLLLGNGNGTFRAGQGINYPAQQTLDISVGDFNGDGKPDFVILAGCQLDTFLGSGNGSFQHSGTQIGFAPGCQHIATADVNGDGKLDILMNDVKGGKAVLDAFLGKGDGTLSAPTYSLSLPSATQMALADFDSDGLNDAAVSQNVMIPGDEAGVLLGGGDGTFGPVFVLHNGLMFSSIPVVAADFDGDQRPDVAVSTSGGVAIFLNRSK